GCRYERGTKLGVAGDRSSLEEGLELPRVRPALPVSHVRLERPGEGSVPAFGPQVGVHTEAGASDVHDAARLALAGLGVDRHEQHVDVARVVEFVAAQLAHADDGEARRIREAA